MTIEVNVELLCTKTVPNIPSIRPTIGFVRIGFSWLRKFPVNVIVIQVYLNTPDSIALPAAFPTISLKDVDSKSREQMNAKSRMKTSMHFAPTMNFLGLLMISLNQLVLVKHK